METYVYYDEFGEMDYFYGTYDEFMDFLSSNPECSI